MSPLTDLMGALRISTAICKPEKSVWRNVSASAMKDRFNFEIVHFCCNVLVLSYWICWVCIILNFVSKFSRCHEKWNCLHMHCAITHWLVTLSSFEFFFLPISLSVDFRGRTLYFLLSLSDLKTSEINDLLIRLCICIWMNPNDTLLSASDRRWIFNLSSCCYLTCGVFNLDCNSYYVNIALFNYYGT